jgi:hypothetical protein
MTASKINNEQTFCIKKMHLKHTCPTEPASTRVNAKWLSIAYVSEYKSNIYTSITTLKTKQRRTLECKFPRGWLAGQGPKQLTW